MQRDLRRVATVAMTVKALTIGLALVFAVAAFSVYVASRRSDQTTQTGPPIGAGAAGERSAVPEAPSGQIPRVVDPRDQASERLLVLPGGECQAFGSAFPLPLHDLEARVIKAGGPGHWLQPGVWIGDAEGAVNAFGATWAAQGVDERGELWLEVMQDGKVTMLGLSAMTLRGGTEIWRKTGSAAISKCEADG